MGRHYLSPLFSPGSVAVLGASPNPDEIGGLVWINLLSGGFSGPIHAVNPRYTSLGERPCHPSLEGIGARVDLAVIAPPSSGIPLALEDCRRAGVRAALILPEGLGEPGIAAPAPSKDLPSPAEPPLHILGPGSPGLIRPASGLNASPIRKLPRPGSIALASQSAALIGAVLDWADARQIGFSAVVGPGAASDVGIGDLLDFLAQDPATRAILLFVEAIREARRFMRGLRAAARLKPVIVVKAGRSAHAAAVTGSHTGMLVSGDDVFAAALRRAGVVRVDSIGQLFAAVEILAAPRRLHGDRLAIVSNGGGPAIMATDRALADKLHLARLTALLPGSGFEGNALENPLILRPEAKPADYGTATRAVLADPGTDGALVIFAPHALADPLSTADGVAEAARDSSKPVLTCWLGESQVAAAREHLSAKGIPSFTNPESAVKAFGVLAEYHRNQALLIQVPGASASSATPDFADARRILDTALAERRATLSAIECRALLRACGVPAAPVLPAGNAQGAVAAARSLGFPVVMKIRSPDIAHKTDVDGVRLNLNGEIAVRAAYDQLMAAARRLRPDARLDGVTVERMYLGRGGRELLVAITRDPVFGPAIAFGAGGTAAEILRDRSIALPPLNHLIAEQLIDRTRIAGMLGAFRNLPPANRDAILSVLLRLSEIACELPAIVELEINPLVVDERGAEALDVRIAVEAPPAGQRRYGHMAIHPYPADLITRLKLRDGSEVLIRPIRPEDADIEKDFVRKLSDEAKFFRFMNALQELRPELLVRLTQLDYDRELALIATIAAGNGEEEIGVARYFGNPDGETVEFALVVADAWQHLGLGGRMMERLIASARDKGFRVMEGTVLANNRKMLAFVKKLGFSRRNDPDDPGVVLVARDL